MPVWRAFAASTGKDPAVQEMLASKVAIRVSLQCKDVKSLKLATDAPTDTMLALMTLTVSLSTSVYQSEKS